MSDELLATAILALCLGGGCFLWYRRRRKLEAEWEAQHPRSAFEYCGKTLLFYGDSHGNQVEYLDTDGYCYLWYPGNPVIVVGRWRSDGSSVYFRYGINTYNPVTGIIGGRWEPCPIEAWSASIVEAVPGDPLEIKKRLPFVLKRHPPLRSIDELRSRVFGRK